MNLDEMRPELAKSFLDKQVVHAHPDPQIGKPAEQARQEIDDGLWLKGSKDGAFQPATGEVLTLPSDQRTTVNRIDFLAHIEQWILVSVERVHALLDNLSMHRATDVLLFCLAHPRGECVFHLSYASYLNLVEPWWKTLRSLAIKGRRFETREEVCDAIARATTYWNAHRHPFFCGRRCRHRPHRSSRIVIPAHVRSFDECTTWHLIFQTRKSVKFHLLMMEHKTSTRRRARAENQGVLK